MPLDACRKEVLNRLEVAKQNLQFISTSAHEFGAYLNEGDIEVILDILGDCNKFCEDISLELEDWSTPERNY